MLRGRDATGHERQIQNIVSLSALYSRLAAQGIRVSAPHELTGLDESGQAIIDAWVEASVDTLIDTMLAINCLMNPEAVLIGGRLPAGIVDQLATRLNQRLEAHAGNVPAIAPVARAALVRRCARRRRRHPAIQPPPAADAYRAHEGGGALNTIPSAQKLPERADER